MGIIELDYKENMTEPIAIALGYFDSVHLGHCSLIEECTNSEYKSAVFTFKNNPMSSMGGSDKQIFTYYERLGIFTKLRLDYVISSYFDDKFKSQTGEEFLIELVNNFNIRKIVIGDDYRCGCNASYGVVEITEFCTQRHIELKVLDMLLDSERKIASRDIREMLIEGDIIKVNQLLPYRYSLTGMVQRGRNVGGRVLGYPTANINYPVDKLQIREGVYKTSLVVDNVSYIALTNVGNHPTFDDYIYNVESFILNYDGELYGKIVRVDFVEFLRGVLKFDTAEQLKAQITYDIDRVMEDL